MSMHPAAMTEEELIRGCEVFRGRRGGPGGQHRNKVETAVRLVHRATGLEGQASERRSQAENRRVALRRLRWRLAVEVREAVG
ncbi:MAG: peptide chain release factor-like protein, partial [Planctomycetota bacterium]